MASNYDEKYIRVLVTYKICWADHGKLTSDGKESGYCSDGESKEMNDEIVKQERIVRIFEYADVFRSSQRVEDINILINKQKVKDKLQYKLNCCSSMYGYNNCNGCYTEYIPISVKYLRDAAVSKK